MVLGVLCLCSGLVVGVLWRRKRVMRSSAVKEGVKRNKNRSKSLKVALGVLCLCRGLVVGVL